MWSMQSLQSMAASPPSTNKALAMTSKFPILKTGDRVIRRGYGWTGTIAKMDVQGDIPDKDFSRKAAATVKWDNASQPPMMCGVAELDKSDN
jgi:hypothetical protein